MAIHLKGTSEQCIEHQREYNHKIKIIVQFLSQPSGEKPIKYWRKTHHYSSILKFEVLKKTCSQQEIEKEESRKLSINDVIDRTVQSNFTDRQAIGMMQTVRKNFGKNSVQANAMVETGRNKEKGSKFFY